MKRIKNLKPIQLDINIKYRCPECGWEHWASLLESRTKEFVIVCNCKTVLKPKRISKINIIYTEEKPQPTAAQSQTVETKVFECSLTSEDILQATQTLINYGFTKAEAKTLIDENIKSQKIESASALVKICISKFGEHNNV